MKTKYNLEEIKCNLPDYISNNIADKELICSIEKELKTNSELREDLEELKSTFGFLKTSGFQVPPDNYFANLPVKINERIQTTEVDRSFLDRLSLFWKILIPAITVILIVILLFNSSKNDTDKIQTTNADSNKNELRQKKPEPVENKNNVSNEINGNDSKNKIPLTKIVKKDNNIPKTFRKLHKNNVEEDQNNVENQSSIKEYESVVIPEIKEQLSELLADNIEIIEDSNSDERVDVMYSGDDDENEVESLDDEFLNLTPEQQKEIIDNLLKAQI